ncbi:hypothetical protein C6A85_09515, partial [Mycobacterium sp. ITM-2017-0098]
AVTLAGPTCDSADVIARGYPMPTVGIGDVLISPVMGAYTSVTGSRLSSAVSSSLSAMIGEWTSSVITFE